MLIVSIACMLAVLLEELFLRRSRLRFFDYQDQKEESLPPKLQRRVELFQKRYRVIRVVQFIAFGLLWVLAGEAAGRGLLLSPLGQLTAALMLLQMIRVLGRRVVKSWPLLTITGIQQTIQAVLVPVLAGRSYGPPPPQGAFAFLHGLFVVVATVASALAFSAAVVYLFRISPGGARLFGEELPPLAASERIARMSLVVSSIMLACASAGCLPSLAGNGTGNASVLAAPLAGLALCLVSLVICADPRKFHHPAGMVAALLPYPFLMVSIVSGLTTAWF